jgi:nucleoside triphosphate pyrophosphatase
MPNLVLASSSPRRALLLSSAGFHFAQVSPEIDEAPLPGESPEQVVIRLARAKALAANPPNAISLGADTAVILDGEALGKPTDRDEAVAMILRLAGRTHAVITGWALASGGAVVEDGLEVTLVSMQPISAAEAEAYADSGEPMDKAGGYALQGDGGRFVTGIAGPRSNVIGLPLTSVVPALERAGVLSGTVGGDGDPGEITS